jgi:hypothetical protein
VDDEIETQRRGDRGGFRGEKMNPVPSSDRGFHLEPNPNFQNSALFSANFASLRFDEINF